MPKLLSALAIVAGALGLAGCEELDPVGTTDTGSLTLAFRGTVGSEDLRLEREAYEATGVEGFVVTRLSFFLSDVQLVRQIEGQSLKTLVDEVAYVELDDEGRAQVSFDGVPVGDYTGLEFTVGLNAEQDATTPAEYSAPHPLARDDEYWEDWGSYIFLKVEGKSDTLADDVERFDAPIVYHVGRSAEHAATLLLPTSVPLHSDGGATVQLGIDVGELLGVRTSEQLRLDGGIDHGNATAQIIMDHVPQAITTR